MKFLLSHFLEKVIKSTFLIVLPGQLSNILKFQRDGSISGIALHSLATIVTCAICGPK